MEVLFEYKQSRRRLNPPSSEVLLDFLLAELKSFDKNAFICGSQETTGSADAAKAPRGTGYLLQKWSNKWGNYVDVGSVDEVVDGDKLTVVPEPSASQTVSYSVDRVELEPYTYFCFSNVSTSTVPALLMYRSHVFCTRTSNLCCW